MNHTNIPNDGIDTPHCRDVTPPASIPLEQLWRDLNSEEEVFEFSKRLIDERLGLAMKILAEKSN